MNKKILLCCGAGMSSGFLASAATKSAMSQGLDYDITAKSQSVALDELPDYDLLLLGPHFQAHLDEFKETARDMDCDTPIAVIPKEIYGNVDGASLVAFARKFLNE